ncbi:MAG: amidohydrolase [Oscillospiraceae bacterium]|nr:amidohydrolase [Oscillospiraceae bacterium]
MQYLNAAKAHEDYIIAMRRYFHENPELSGKELQTVERIAKELADMQIEYTVIENGGILAKIGSEKQGEKAVLLRADVDALPVEESENLVAGKRTCFSKTPGLMHACGHDGHIAMLLGAAKMLKEREQQLAGTVYLCFERGEEFAGNVRFIFPYIEKNNIKIDAVYAQHLFADLPSGYFGINDGGMMAGSMWFSITLEGSGGHGSRPDEAVSPIDCFAAIYQRLQSLRVTKVNPFETCTYSVGTLHSGSQGNVIPQTLTFGGTMRTFDRDGAGMQFYHAMREAVDGIAAAYGCKATYDNYQLPGYAVVNDAALASWCRDILAEEFEAQTVGTVSPWMASESFCQYQLMWPGVYAFLGVRNEEIGSGAPHHNPAFDIDEAVLVKGAAAAAAFAAEYLQNNALPAGRKMTYREYLPKIDREADIAALYNE